jgi:hypothetical protein
MSYTKHNEKFLSKQHTETHKWDIYGDCIHLCLYLQGNVLLQYKQRQPIPSEHWYLPNSISSQNIVIFTETRS